MITYNLYKNGTLQADHTKSEILKFYPEVSEGLTEEDNGEFLSLSDIFCDNYFVYDGDEFTIEEKDADEALIWQESVTNELDALNFNKSSNNSWYFKNNNIEIRVSDHPRIYPSSMDVYFDFNINSVEDLDNIYDDIYNLINN